MLRRKTVSNPPEQAKRFGEDILEGETIRLAGERQKIEVAKQQNESVEKAANEGASEQSHSRIFDTLAGKVG